MVYENGMWLQEQADDLAITHIFNKVSIELLPIVRLYQVQKFDRCSNVKDIIALITEIISDKLSKLQKTPLYQDIVNHPDYWQGSDI